MFQETIAISKKKNNFFGHTLFSCHSRNQVNIVKLFKELQQYYSGADSEPSQTAKSR